jgi:hypothetical protein
MRLFPLLADIHSYPVADMTHHVLCWANTCIRMCCDEQDGDGGDDDQHDPAWLQMREFVQVYKPSPHVVSTVLPAAAPGQYGSVYTRCILRHPGCVSSSSDEQHMARACSGLHRTVCSSTSLPCEAHSQSCNSPVWNLHGGTSDMAMHIPCLLSQAGCHPALPSLHRCLRSMCGAHLWR